MLVKNGQVPMLTPVQQKRVWEGLLSAEIRANYFAEYSGRYHWRQRAATFATLFLSSGALATFLLADPSAVVVALRPWLALGTAALSAYSLVAQNQKSAVDAADLHTRWNKLAAEYERLWDDMYGDDAAVRLRELEDKGAELSKAGTAFPNDEKAMLRWQLHVEKHHAVDAAA